MTKRICILTMGTLGDVRPYCALGLALRRNGYLVRMAVPENFITYSTDLGLETVRCGEDFHELMKAAVAKRFFAAGYFRRQLLAPQFAKHLFRSVCQDVFEATTDASAIIFHPKIEIGLDLARSKGVPAFLASVVPIIPTSKFPIYTSSKRSWGSLLNYLSYRGYAINRARFSSEFREFATQKLKVAAPPRWAYPYDTRSKDFITLCGISPTLLDRPNDWSYTVHMTGYWTSSSPEREPDAALDAFLDAGPAPLYIGFGSMIGDPRKQTEVILRALTVIGERAVIATGWGAMDVSLCLNSSPSVHVVSSVPHDYLFPRVKAVVHHGGAGTTVEGIRAGKPSLVCPFFGDQYFWGRLVSDLGAGPQPLPVSAWNVDNVASALTALTKNAQYVDAARSIGMKLEEEDGVDNACRIVAAVLGHPES